MNAATRRVAVVVPLSDRPAELSNDNHIFWSPQAVRYLLPVVDETHGFHLRSEL
jgi:hypothetical protein